MRAVDKATKAIAIMLLAILILVAVAVNVLGIRYDQMLGNQVLNTYQVDCRYLVYNSMGTPTTRVYFDDTQEYTGHRYYSIGIWDWERGNYVIGDDYSIESVRAIDGRSFYRINGEKACQESEMPPMYYADNGYD